MQNLSGRPECIGVILHSFDWYFFTWGIVYIKTNHEIDVGRGFSYIVIAIGSGTWDFSLSTVTTSITSWYWTIIFKCNALNVYRMLPVRSMVVWPLQNHPREQKVEANCLFWNIKLDLWEVKTLAIIHNKPINFTGKPSLNRDINLQIQISYCMYNKWWGMGYGKLWQSMIWRRQVSSCALYIYIRSTRGWDASNQNKCRYWGDWLM